MKIREVVHRVAGWRYILEGICLHSGPGQRHLNEQILMTEIGPIQAALSELTATVNFLQAQPHDDFLNDTARFLCNVLDIVGTLEKLRAGEILDDVALFQIKDFALTSERLRGLLGQHGFTIITIPSLEETVSLLDPEGKGVREFFIYDQYDAKLKEARRALVRLQGGGGSAEEEEKLRIAALQEEDRVREELVQELRHEAKTLLEALDAIAHLDLLLAKARLVRQEGLTAPTLTQEGVPTFKGLFHPEVRARLRERSMRYQAIDLTLAEGVTLITGANMAGKSVLLQSVQLAQFMLQFGLYVPAESALMRVYRAVFSSFGDRENSQGGLSSFGAEILHLNHLMQLVKGGIQPLVLLDELARTTNPTEGAAIVNAVVQYLTEKGICALVTTHFSHILAPCRRLRVKGFRGDASTQHVGIEQLNASIDYSLQEVEDGSVPHEAINVARMLGVDPGLLARCEEFLKG